MRQVPIRYKLFSKSLSSLFELFLVLFILFSSGPAKAQTVALSNWRPGSRLYQHVENRLKVLVENHSCGEFIITCNYGKLEQDSCWLTYCCDHTVAEEYFEVFLKEGDSLRWIWGKHYEVRKFRIPLIRLSGKITGNISKIQICEYAWLVADDDVEHNYYGTNISQYNCRVYRGDSLVYEELNCTGRSLSNQTKQFICEKAQSGDTIEVSNITMLLFGIEPRKTNQVISIKIR